MCCSGGIWPGGICLNFIAVHIINYCANINNYCKAFTLILAISCN